MVIVLWVDAYFFSRRGRLLCSTVYSRLAEPATACLSIWHACMCGGRLARQLEWGWGVACWRASVVLRWHLEGLFPRDWSERRAYLCGAQALVLLARKLGRLLLVAADPRL